MTNREFAHDNGLTDIQARKALERMVKQGLAEKTVSVEMVYRRVRGYSEKLMPTKVTHYYIKESAQ